MQAAIRYRDETILCRECNKPFMFTAREQAQFADRGYENKPKRCRPCREGKRSGRTFAPGNPKNNLATRHLDDRDLLVEVCKAVNELQVLVARRIDRLEEKIEQLLEENIEQPAGDHGKKEDQKEDQETNH